MKLATYFSLLIVAFLFSYAYADLPQDMEKDLPLLNKPDPVLTGVEPLCVVVISHSDEPNRTSGLLKNIKRKTEADLKKAGIEVLVVPDEHNPPELPELRISVDIFRPENSNRCFLHIQTSLAKLVYLEKDLSISIKTDIWKIGPVMELSPLENLQAMTTRTVSKQVDVFIHACIAANAAGKSSDSSSPIITPTQVGKSETAKSSYVASKNGKAFHKPACSSAARIKPENLVTYNSREQACAAGKNPCKQCKP
jgi:hypothetical protein